MTREEFNKIEAPIIESELEKECPHTGKNSGWEKNWKVYAVNKELNICEEDMFGDDTLIVAYTHRKDPYEDWTREDTYKMAKRIIEKVKKNYYETKGDVN